MNLSQFPQVRAIRAGNLLALCLIFAPPLSHGDLLAAGAAPRTLSSTNYRIVFVSARDGNSEIYTVGVDGTGLTRLTTNAAVDEFPTWSPDGLHIAFQSNRTGTFEIYVMNADGSNVV